MMKIKIGEKSFDVREGISGLELMKEFPKDVPQQAVVMRVDGELRDISSGIGKDAVVEFFTFDSDEGLDVFRHSSAHLLAQAVMRLYPEAKTGIGPNVEQGFYYDFGNLKVKEEDIPAIEKEMEKICKENLVIEREECSADDAVNRFGDNRFKQEIIRDSGEQVVSMYTQGDFVDLCRGPHLPRTGMLKAVKVMKLAGAYWRGDAKNEMLTRIYGISFPDKKQLRQYLHLLAEAEKRDHRKIGRELDWFSFHDVSPGSPFFHPKGAVIFLELIRFMQKQYWKYGYDEVITPLVYDKALWETSGHWEHFKENIFTLEMDEREAALKPMNCPSHCIIYKNGSKSYRDLPLRIADFAALHRNELRGTLGGLTRVRKMSQDDAHIFCTPEQIEKELFDLIAFTKFIYQDVFDFDFSVELSTKPEKAMGSQELWDQAEKVLAEALEKKGLKYTVNEGDGAFYGPKIDYHIKDALGRSHQLATLQLDFQLPERFDLWYEGSDGKKHRPVMIHRAILGTLERFIGILIEHYAGKLPLWLNPVQVKVLPIADRHLEFANRVVSELHEKNVRVELDARSESVNKKVRDAQLEQVNYILVVGDKEVESESVNVRTRENKVEGAVSLGDFVGRILTELN
ncbi:threonine--tRNA ligase [Candidatus Woesearchaeota archaeon]|nr:threonine--tRNA ligase [Candidatus Woesearchaeota archaeon]